MNVKLYMKLYIEILTKVIYEVLYMNAKLSLDIIMGSFKKCFSGIIPCSLCCSFTKIYVCRVDGFVVGRNVPHISVPTHGANENCPFLRSRIYRVGHYGV